MEDSLVRDACQRFVRYLETGDKPEDVFSEDVFLDFTLPLWRIQAKGLAAVHGVRMRGHPDPGQVPRWSAVTTGNGFAMQAEERWTNAKSHWYCREAFFAELRDGKVCRLSVYCTGDWDAERQQAHQNEVALIEP